MEPSTYMKYTKLPVHYKYQLRDDYIYLTNIMPKVTIVSFPQDHPFITLDTTGLLTLRAGYAWDGASCAPDVKEIMRGSLVHDALYQLMRDGLLDNNNDENREKADGILRDICMQDGMSKSLAKIVYKAVQTFGKSALNQKEDTVIMQIRGKEEK